MAHDVAQHTTSLRDMLRCETHAAHERLHEHASFVALFNQRLDLEGYRALMLRFYGFYLPLERAILRAAASEKTPYAYAPRARLIAQDLFDLGLDTAAIHAAPLCPAIGRVVTPHTLGGVIYVIEGSTLGAKPIDRAAQRLLDPQHTKGRIFWAWCRAQNTSRWHLAMQYLDHLSRSQAPEAPLATGAREVFEALGDWLAPLDTSPPALQEATP